MHFIYVLANPLQVLVGLLAELTLNWINVMDILVMPPKFSLVLCLIATLVAHKCHLTFFKVVPQLLLRFIDELTLCTRKPSKVDQLHMTFQRIELGSPFPEYVSDMTPPKLLVRDRVKHWGVWTVTAETLCFVMHHMGLVPAR